MPVLISYSTLLIGIALTLGTLLVLYLLRRRWRSHPEGLQSRFRPTSPPDPLQQEIVLSLMVYEEEYPAFGAILTLVLGHFRLQSFMRREHFKTAIHFLEDSVYNPAPRDAILASMTTIVREFVSDPEVAYRCRPDLEDLIDRFLIEIEAETE